VAILPSQFLTSTLVADCIACIRTPPDSLAGFNHIHRRGVHDYISEQARNLHVFRSTKGDFRTLQMTRGKSHCHPERNEVESKGLGRLLSITPRFIYGGHYDSLRSERQTLLFSQNSVQKAL
jgi:hypothetical protein